MAELRLGPAKGENFQILDGALRMPPVDLGVRQWYQKQSGLVGVLPILGRGRRFYTERFTPAGMNAKRGACRKLDHR